MEKKAPSRPLYTHPAATQETTFFLRVAFITTHPIPSFRLSTVSNRESVQRKKAMLIQALEWKSN